VIQGINAIVPRKAKARDPDILQQFHRRRIESLGIPPISNSAERRRVKHRLPFRGLHVGCGLQLSMDRQGHGQDDPQQQERTAKVQDSPISTEPEN